MPVKRTIAKARPHPITPAAVEAYRAGDWGGLHRALALKPWHELPLHIGDLAPPGMSGRMLDDWHMVAGLRDELERALS